MMARHVAEGGAGEAERAPAAMEWLCRAKGRGGAGVRHVAARGRARSRRAGGRHGGMRGAADGGGAHLLKIDTAFGKVYKGTIGGTQLVAVKCSAAKGKTPPVEEFKNKIMVLLKVNHNVLRLLGCCLETDVPMLVFEFVPNGSLYKVLHGIDHQSPPPPPPLPKRLDIAIDSAEALACMHTNGDHTLIHGDVKSANILLDDHLVPKVSDFGSSKLLTTGYTRFVAADMNYIDPVCLKTGRLTLKSDVYSFGVVLLELITRKKAKYGDNSLPIDFVKSWKVDGNGRSMYDTELFSGVVESQCYMQCLHQVGALACQCLKEDADERPAMLEVLKELKQVWETAFGGSCSETN
ncbi:hypothetical protein U9M48_000621 [Paspalum notatum var. saurae]|uniref:Protein kinase domain-containing protein n=1 Tax=Paspalum notatum var. saurae TaxID=547442 RepID=A0AAQ3SG28_PASNO